MSLVSIDPGLEKVAVAQWDATTLKLLYAGLIVRRHAPGTERAQKWRDMAFEVFYTVGRDNSLILEIPQVYARGKGDPNDLIDLAGVLGALAGVCGDVAWAPLPREWKGQLPKQITKARVEEKLGPLEKLAIQWPSESLKHNVYDAIHLGIVYLEREGLRDFTKKI